ncbi:cysteine desulfurase family protein [Ignatzschineria larvae DSM 13226]|uniref:Cysteine desulfurase family protein n=1 Tax=Ignatzschineria larvae DSM 13226 TaxID=1111732 RepID=A0ABZ3BWG8_9GAMM|nr:cysteine desulfurase family protein [Ignatzschineria larvae]
MKRVWDIAENLNDTTQNQLNQQGKGEIELLKLPTKPHFSDMVYLDYAATTPVDPLVIEAMVNAMERHWANISSPHELGAMTTQYVQEALEQIARHFNVTREEITITSGATESINHALKGVLQAQKKREIITTTIEHKATINTVQSLMKMGYKGHFIAPNSEGTITAEMIESAINEETALISLIWVNNETGDKLPVEAIAKMARKYKIPIHIDATQAAPHFQFDASQFDLVSLSAHKCYGPKNIGLLYRRAFPKLPMQHLMDGSGGQMLRAGTMPNEGVLGFAKALSLIAANWRDERHRLVRLEGLLLRQLLPLGVEVNSASIVRKDSQDDQQMGQQSSQQSNRERDKIFTDIINSEPQFADIKSGIKVKAEREPGVLNLYLPDVHADTLLALVPKLALAKGSACNSDSTLPSYVLTEMGYDERRAFSSIRVSVGRYTTEEEILYAGELLRTAIEFIQSIAKGRQTNWYGEYNIYDPYIESLLSPTFIAHDFTEEDFDGSTHLITIEKPYFSLSLYGVLERSSIADGAVFRFRELSAKAYGAPYYLALFQTLITSLREEMITTHFKLEQLIDQKTPAEYLRDTIYIERALQTFLQDLQ